MAEVSQLWCNSPERAPCTLCGKEGLPCARCRLDFYCCKEHQRQDWARHKHGCGVLELRQSKALGRHLVVTKDVPVGTAVLRDQPLLSVVPPWAGIDVAWCVGCLVDKNAKDFLGVRASFSKQCPQCGWPVCSEECGSNPAHQPECREFQRAGFKLTTGPRVMAAHLLWVAISALRTYLAFEKHPELLNLQSSYGKPLDGTWSMPPTKSVLGVNDANSWRCLITAASRQKTWDHAATWLRVVVGLHWLPQDGLVRAAGINDVNGVHLTPLATDVSIRGRMSTHLFPGVAMVEHCCAPTGMLASRPGGSPSSPLEHVILTTRNLKAGEHLSRDYLEAPFQDSVMRRILLRRGWSFVCDCSQCRDPTSGGQYLGCPCCPKCAEAGKKALMVPFGVVDGSRDADFRCQGCGQSSSVPRLLKEHDILIKLKAKMKSADKHGSSVEKLMWPRGPLHPTHSLVLNAEFSMLLCLQQETYYAELPCTDDEVDRHLKKVAKLLATLDAVKPGLGHHRWALLLNGNHMCELVNNLQCNVRSNPSVSVLKKVFERLLKMQSFARQQLSYYFIPGDRKTFVDQYVTPVDEAVALTTLSSVKI